MIIIIINRLYVYFSKRNQTKNCNLVRIIVNILESLLQSVIIKSHRKLTCRTNFINTLYHLINK